MGKKSSSLIQGASIKTGAYMPKPDGVTLIQLTVVGSVGPVSATVRVWGTADNLGDIDLGTITASSTGAVASAVDVVEVPYAALRADIEAVNGGTAIVTQIAE